jgi:putative ABC transport system permease protein
MRDLRLAVRTLRATPVVSVVATLSLALGIGANTAIFSILNGLLLKSLPVHEPAQLALLTRGNSGTPDTQEWPYIVWDEIQHRGNLVDGVFAWSATPFDLGTGVQADVVDGLWVSGGFFDGLGVHAAQGRTLNDADDQRHGGVAGPVLVISHSFWQRRFGGSPDVIGPHAHRRARAVHDCRRRATELLWCRGRPYVRRRGAVRRRAAHPWEGKRA